LAISELEQESRLYCVLFVDSSCVFLFCFVSYKGWSN